MLVVFRIFLAYKSQDVIQMLAIHHDFLLPSATELIVTKSFQVQAEKSEIVTRYIFWWGKKPDIEVITGPYPRYGMTTTDWMTTFKFRVVSNSSQLVLPPTKLDNPPLCYNSRRMRLITMVVSKKLLDS